MLRDRLTDAETGPQVLLDANELADGSGYVELGLTLVSPDERWLAYSVDRTGDEVYELRFRDLETGADLPEVVPRTYYGGAWSADSDHFFYTRPRRRLPAVPGLAPRARHAGRRRRAGPRGAGRALRAERAGDPQRRARGDLGGEPRHPRGVGGRRARPRRRRRARSAAAARASSTTPSTCVLPDGSATRTLLLVTNDDATEFRLARCPVPRDADQDHTTWAPARPEDPDERLERVDAFAGARRAELPVGDPAPACGCCRSTPSTPTAS